MKKWTSKKLFIIVIDVFTVISLLLQAQATAVMYDDAAKTGFYEFTSKPLMNYSMYGLYDALFNSSGLIELYKEYALDRDIYYNIAEAIVNNYSLQIMVNVLFWGLIITFFMSFFVVFIKIRGKKKGEKYLLPVAVSIIYVVMRIIGVYQGLLQAFSQ